MKLLMHTERGTYSMDIEDGAYDKFVTTFKGTLDTFSSGDRFTFEVDGQHLISLSPDIAKTTVFEIVRGGGA